MVKSANGIKGYAAWALLCITMLGWSCKPDPLPEPLPIDFENGILLVNEGNFQAGNASLSFISHVYAADTIVNQAFHSHVGHPLGDVAQSITVLGNKAYVVVNNSGKIEVLNLPSLEQAATITGLTSPRYLLPIGSGRALVTDLYSHSIHVVDLGSNQVTAHIATGGWTEEMLLQGNHAFVCQTGTDKLLVIDTGTLALVDSLEVGREPNSIVQDRNGDLWVLCGSALGQAIPSLQRLDPDSMRVMERLDFSSNMDSPSKLCINATGDTLYFLNGGIYRMAIGDASLPMTAWVPKGNHNWYGLDIDPRSGYVYATDAMDYQHRGQLLRFAQQTGQQLKSWTAGMIPSELAFLP